MHSSRDFAGWKRSVMVGGPLLLGFLLLFHPNGYGVSPGDRVLQLASIRERWLALHLALLPLFALLGLIVLWMLPGTGTASRVSRIALSAYIVLYPAFDALVGIGSGMLLGYRATLSGDGQALLDKPIENLFVDPAGAGVWLALAGSAAWIVGAVAAALSLWQSRGWRVSFPLLVSGVVFGIGHVSPIGPLANLALSIATWQFLVTQRDHSLDRARATLVEEQV